MIAAEVSEFADSVVSSLLSMSPLERTSDGAPRRPHGVLGPLGVFEIAGDHEIDQSDQLQILCAVARSAGTLLVDDGWIDQCVAAMALSFVEHALATDIQAGRTIAATSFTASDPSAQARLRVFHDTDDLCIINSRNGQASFAVVPARHLGFDASPSPTGPGIARLSQPKPPPLPIGADIRDRLLVAALLLAANFEVGAAQRALESAVNYAKSRVQFGRPIGAFQAIKHKLADVAAALHHATAFAGGVAAERFTQSTDQIDAAMAVKWLADVTFQSVSEATLQVFGGIGFTTDVDCHLYLKSAMKLGQYPITTAQLVEAIAAGRDMRPAGRSGLERR